MAAFVIVMVESGRLGNQVFQYLALRSVAAPKERITLLGFDHLRATFDGVDARFVRIASNPLKHLVSLDLAKVVQGAGRLPAVGAVREDASGLPLRGKNSPLALVEPSWFQHDSVLRVPALEVLTVKPRWRSAAQDFLTDNGLRGESTAFVHVRAGDYRVWPSAEFPAILTPHWYRSRIEELRHEHPGLAIVAIGDDPEYTSEVIQGIPGAQHFSGESATAYAEEFALMTLCSFGVLSASSFAYWGAYFSKRDHPHGRFLGPRFWAGHATGEWFPHEFTAEFIDFR